MISFTSMDVFALLPTSSNTLLVLGLILLNVP